MASFHSIEYFIGLLSIGMLVSNVANRFYEKNFRPIISDLFLIFLAIACVLKQSVIIETLLFFCLSASLFKDTVKFQIGLSKKIISFLVIGINACVLYYIQTKSGTSSAISASVVWLFLSFLLIFPIVITQQQISERLKNASFYHLNLRFLMILIMHTYITNTINPILIYCIVGAAILLLLISLFYRKILVNKIFIQGYISTFLISLALIYQSPIEVLLLISALLFVIDKESLSLQTHNRRWIEMLEWPTWQSPVFILLIVAISGIKNSALGMKALFISYVFILAIVSVFRPEKTMQEAVNLRQKQVIFVKSAFVVIAVILLERFL